MRNSLLLSAFAASTLFATAPITIVVADPAGLGFNDTTPATPVGGNTGATIGEQRLNVFRYAASIWSSKLDSTVPIRVRASFGPLDCSPLSAIAGTAGPTTVYTIRSSNTEILPNVWYPAALANKLLETVLDPGTEEINAVFNPSLGQPDCTPQMTWYYGFDTNAPAGTISMATVVLHELAHGLGFLPNSEADGSRLGGRNDVYGQYVLDLSSGKTWNDMTDKERTASVSNAGHVVWNGINVRKDVPKVLQTGTPLLRVTEPASSARDVTVGASDFGAPLSAPGVSGELVAALNQPDVPGSSPTDACSPLTNTSEIAGRIALVDRGTCTFVRKGLNAQTAGAIGLVLVNNVEHSPNVNPGGTDPTITIPVVFISLAEGNALKAFLAAFETVNVRLLMDPKGRRGADAADRPLLYAPNPIESLSPIGHWDPSTYPNQLMEPDITPDLGLTVEPPRDLTLSLLRDIGWFADFDGVPDGVDQCPGSDRGANLSIRGCDTGVRNTTYTTGCRISDYYKPCAGETGGNFAACVESVSKEMLKAGAIGTADSTKIQACAERSAVP